MTNSERITAHNARLAAMKETVAELPDAGGGGGGAVETCTVTVSIIMGTSSAQSVTFYHTKSSELQTTSLTVYGELKATFEADKNTLVFFDDLFCDSLSYASITGGKILHLTNGWIVISLEADNVILNV